MNVAIHITSLQAKDEKFLEAQIRFADRIGAELLIDHIIEKPKPYECCVWLDQNEEIACAEFRTKREALEWSRKMLAEHPSAIIDLKKWNRKGDDFEDWQYRIVDGTFTEVDDFGW